jgi:hypothetical protein
MIFLLQFFHQNVPHAFRALMRSSQIQTGRVKFTNSYDDRTRESHISATNSDSSTVVKYKARHRLSRAVIEQKPDCSVHLQSMPSRGLAWLVGMSHAAPLYRGAEDRKPHLMLRDRIGLRCGQINLPWKSIRVLQVPQNIEETKNPSSILGSLPE